MRAAIARTAFGNFLCEDQRTWDLFLRWGTRTGAIYAACSAALLLDAIAERYGFPDIAKFLDSIDPDI